MPPSDSSRNPKRVNPKRVNPNFGFTLFGFTLLRYFQIYPRYANIYNINTKYQAAAGPAQAKGRAGLVFCIYFVYLVYLVYLWIYLDHFFEIFGIFRPGSVVHWSESDTPICQTIEFPSNNASQKLV